MRTLPEYLRELGYRVLLAGKTHIQPKDEFPFEYIDTEGDWTATIVSEESEVADFLRRDAMDSQPFCLVIATDDPHVPWPYEHDYDPADMPLHPYLLNTAKTRQAMANYYADVERIDEEVGRILDLLDEEGLADDTVFVYTSDQGPQLPHAKWELYDYGINVPFLVRWPDRVEAGSTSDAMISSVDVLPTLIEMAGGTAPSGIDGWSFQAVLEREQAQRRDEVFATYMRDGMMNYYPMRAIRTERYKYIWNLSPERAFTNHITNSNNFRGNGGAGLFNSWLARANQDTDARDRVRHYQHRPPEELYDLRKDPHELNDVAAGTAYQDVKADLREQLTRWMEQQRDEGRQSWSTRFDEE